MGLLLPRTYFSPHRNADGGHKQRLMGCSCKRLEDSRADSGRDSGGPGHEDPGRSKVPVNNLARGHSFDTLGRNLAVFCPCPKILPEAKLKSSRLVPLLEETARQDNI